MQPTDTKDVMCQISRYSYTFVQGGNGPKGKNVLVLMKISQWSDTWRRQGRPRRPRRVTETKKKQERANELYGFQTALLVRSL